MDRGVQVATVHAAKQLEVTKTEQNNNKSSHPQSVKTEGFRAHAVLGAVIFLGPIFHDVNNP